MRRARIADLGAQRIDQRLRVHARFLGERFGNAARADGDRAAADVLAGHPEGLERTLQSLRRDVHVALIADPAPLPRVIEVNAGGAEMIDKVDRYAVRAQKPGNRLTRADQHRRRRVTKRELGLGGGGRLAQIGSDAQLRCPTGGRPLSA